MPDVQFDDSQHTNIAAQQYMAQRGMLPNSSVKGFAGLLIKMGIIKNPDQAPAVMVMVVIFNIIVTAVVIFGFIL